ncbi:hypothetical protein Pla110_37440 [Polystyrenella longa]|uniref:Uncharacterized protein n=1 Tax=Polystyrenella longa TaxID=2528007 RepID=A0A518CRZ0_9PLAN|nr:hypothetical protein Pla110_37440 [Polystyrenella longa]
MRGIAESTFEIGSVDDGAPEQVSYPYNPFDTTVFYIVTMNYPLHQIEFRLCYTIGFHLNRYQPLESDSPDNGVSISLALTGPLKP